MMTENTQCIASALRNSILNLGVIPKVVYQDNGRAFKSKFFQSCDFDEDGFNGVYANLNIHSVFAKPYNARAKVIGRFFREFQEEFEKMMPSYIGTIGVVSPFRTQVNKIRELIHKDTDLVSRMNSINLLINTAHGFQGDERDIIIFSPVVSNNITSGATLFLSKEENVFNVAITRARAHLIIIGNKHACLKSGIPYLEKFTQYVIDLEDKYSNKYPEVSNDELEEMFYNKLINNNINVIPQYQTCGYSLDFALITTKGNKLDIELDEKNYHKQWNGEILSADRIREQKLYNDNWSIIRFWAYEIINHSDACIKKIQKWIDIN